MSEAGVERAGPERAGLERAGLGTLATVFVRLSLLGFGGPNAHIALILDEVVERRRWLTREHFHQIVAVTNLLPGPSSSGVAITQAAPGLKAALKGVNAVVAGAILGVGLGLVPDAATDPGQGVLLALALAAVFWRGVAAHRVILVGLLAGGVRLLVRMAT